MPAPLRRTLLYVTAAVVAVTLTACADEEDPQVVPGGSGSETTEPSSPSPEPTDTSSGQPVTADLTIAVDDGSGATTTRTLTCEPAGGDVTDPAAACEQLATAWPTAFQPVPKDQACTMIFGGPEKATVTGTIGDEQVLAEFSRTDGCQIERWSSVEALLGAAPGASS